MGDHINVKYTVGYISTIAFLFFKVGFTVTAFPLVSDALHAQYILAEAFVIQDKSTFCTVMTALIPIGAVFGALFTGEINKIGRRNANIFLASAFIVACFMTSMFNFVMLFVGRFIQGFCIGGFTAIVPLFVYEMSPAAIAGPLGVIGQVMGTSGVLLATAFGLLVPYSHDESIKHTAIWQTMFALPALFSLGQIYLYYFVFDHDSPTVYLLKQDYARYETAMSRQYHDYQYKEINNQLLEDKDKHDLYPKVSELSWDEQVSYPQKRALAVGVCIAIFHQGSGMGSVGALAGKIFTKGYVGQDAEYASRMGGVLMALIGVLAGLFALSISHYFGRRTIILTGQYIMLFLLAIL